MAKKVFSNQEATQARPAQAAAEMARRDGPEARKKLFVSFTESNYDFLTVLAQGYGISKTALINQIVTEYREAHEDDAIYQDTLAFIEKVAAQRAAAGYGDLE